MRAYYEILGVDSNAFDKEIRRAFRKLALRYNPDINKDAEAGERFKEICEAYEALSEITRRARPTPDRELTCDMCRGTGEIISRWTEVLRGATLRCPKCLGSGKERRSSRLVNHTPLNCRCEDCNRRWDEWRGRSRTRRPRGVVDQAGLCTKSRILHRLLVQRPHFWFKHESEKHKPLTAMLGRYSLLNGCLREEDLGIAGRKSKGLEQ